MLQNLNTTYDLIGKCFPCCALLLSVKRNGAFHSAKQCFPEREIITFLSSPKKQAEKYYRFDMSNAPKPLKIPHMTRIDKTHIVSGKTPNTFLIRTDKYKQLGYDDNIRMIDHHEFSYRAAGVIVSAMDESAFVFHCHNWFDTNYAGFRNDTGRDFEYIKKKHGDRY